MHIIRLCRWVKGYRLWCINDSRSSKIIINRDITFDKCAILNQKKESSDNIGIYCSVSEQMELDVEALRRVSQNSPI